MSGGGGGGEEPMAVATTDSFWEVAQYKRTVKRVDEGYKLTSDLIEMIKDRCSIEQEYANKLKHHAKTWTSKIEKGHEYGTMESSMKAILQEADNVCEKHLEVRARLLNEVTRTIKEWQKNTYKSTMIPGYLTKNAKEYDDLFRKAQKPWAKLYEKATKAKVDYHKACKAEKTAINQENNSRSDTSQSQDNQSKLRKAVEKCREDKNRARKHYESTLKEINGYNAKYMEDMRDVFEKCQAMEEERLKFYKQCMFAMHQCLNNVDEYPPIYEEMYGNVELVDELSDLQWWSNNHGIHMPMNWPTFQEYSEDFHDITDKSKKGVVAEGSGIMLTNINLQKFNEEFTDYTPEQHAINRKEKLSGGGGVDGEAPVTLTNINKRATTNDVGARQPQPPANPNYNNQQTQPADTINSNSTTVARPPGAAQTVTANGKNTLSSTSSNNPFDEDDDNWDDQDYQDRDDALVDNGDPGVPVRALYDYDGTEEDELTFKQGEEFVKLEDEDEQGWCKGRVNGRVGLYPANYVEAI